MRELYDVSKLPLHAKFLLVKVLKQSALHTDHVSKHFYVIFSTFSLWILRIKLNTISCERRHWRENYFQIHKPEICQYDEISEYIINWQRYFLNESKRFQRRKLWVTRSMANFGQYSVLNIKWAERGIRTKILHSDSPGDHTLW